MAARTEAGTVISIPLSGASVIGSSDFIRIVSNTPVAEGSFALVPEKSTAVTSDYVEDRKGLALDLEIEATPAAEVQLIFDEKIGDVIKGRGSASMRMNIQEWPLQYVWHLYGRKGRLSLYGAKFLSTQVRN